MASGRGLSIKATLPSNRPLPMAEAKQSRKKSMSIKSRLRNWLFNDDSDVPVLSKSDPDELNFREDQSLHFTVIPAAGGRIVQVRGYDERNDRHINKLHIITPDEELATSLAQILQIEQLSR
jgi:hypothetical protein